MQLLCCLLGLLLPAATEAAGYRLGPGDVIDIAVFEVEELSKPVTLSADGAASLPLLGTVELGGLTPEEAAARLRSLYAGKWIHDPQVTVAVREYRSQPVSVLGAVARPGLYQLRGLRRLTDVLALAGGTTPEAGEITVTRAGKVSQVSEREQDLVIQAHDEVRVAPAGMVYVVGEVGRPGGFPLRHRETVTLLKAVALAEGWRRTAAPQRARVIRSAGGARSEIPVRLADVLAGRAPDLALQPGDVLFVPHSQAKGAMARAAEAAVQVATGVVIWRR